MEKSQKEYYLNEQMQAIQKELGEKDEFKAEMAELERRILEKNLSEEAVERLTRELRKLKMMSPMSAEATVVRNYIDWVLSLPWFEYASESLDIEARVGWNICGINGCILAEKHAGPCAFAFLDQPRSRSRRE